MIDEQSFGSRTYHDTDAKHSESPLIVMEQSYKNKKPNGSRESRNRWALN